ncbi:MAG: MotA/TolQ/ExbB proton channel family protein [Planctomycetes bacterium]|nr:MotA/TolQ/ExbB proton channel family protein [Planctomycetota bacterium]
MFALLLLVSAECLAQQPAAPAQPADKPRNEVRDSFLEIILSGGPFGQLITFSIFALSVAAVALVIEHAVTIRAPVLMPPGLGDRVRELLIAGQTAQAAEECRAQPSFLAAVLETGIAEIEGGWSAVEKAMEDATADQAARLSRKVEYLSVVGNLAPMLGLLWTVFGMVLACRGVAATQGVARASDLADGIYQALITTVAGLIVAIPALAAFAFFRNRVDQLVAEVTYMAQHVFTPLKRYRRRRALAEGAG